MTDKATLTDRIAEAIEATLLDLDPSDPDRFTAAADAARTTIVQQLTDYSDAMGRACIKLKHRGATSPDRPCRACSPRISHVSAIIRIIRPDA